MQLNDHGKAARKRIIAHMISEVGRDKVTAWLEDSDNLSLINALCNWVGEADAILERVYARVMSEIDCPTCQDTGQVDSFSSPTGYAGCPDCQIDEPYQPPQFP